MGFFLPNGMGLNSHEISLKFCPVLLNGIGTAQKSISLMLAAAVRD